MDIKLFAELLKLLERVLTHPASGFSTAHRLEIARELTALKARAGVSNE